MASLMLNMIGWTRTFIFVFVSALLWFYMSSKSFKSGNTVNTEYLTGANVLKELILELGSKQFLGIKFQRNSKWWKASLSMQKKNSLTFIVFEILILIKKILINEKISVVKTKLNFFKFTFSLWKICKLVHIILYVMLHFPFHHFLISFLYTVLLRLVSR